MELKEKYTIDDLRAILIRLREPDGCPWDRAQTHQSIKKSLIEETYEAIDALDFGDDHAFANELGDVLLQVVFHARLAEERGAFNFDDVVTEICTKLITRHTHVFGKDHAGTVEESLETWEKNKKKEKNISTYTEALEDVPKYLPALMRAEKIQKKARGFGFDWDNINGVYEKLAEETEELKEAQKEEIDEHIREEYGDLLFTVVNLGRFLGTDPETALTAASNKFINRFKKMEETALEEGKDLAKMTPADLELLWNSAK
ncbi:MAG: nucleoside triphosphate pyrophosphohydrolase [Clostridiales bacterium]|nr:nucleoside triphosphate pyrophosphohydrolase [Clostridiales bacterium]